MPRNKNTHTRTFTHEIDGKKYEDTVTFENIDGLYTYSGYYSNSGTSLLNYPSVEDIAKAAFLSGVKKLHEEQNQQS